MKRLIVNGDDLGLTRGVNAGILRAFKEGVLTSTTLMANGDAFDGAVELALANPRLGVGCHLAVVGGRPVSPPRSIPTLVDGDGMLPATFSHLMIKTYGALRDEDVEREFRAQIERVIASGITPTHLDTHKHSHTLPRIMKVLARLAQDFAIRCVREPFESILAVNTIGPSARTKRRLYLKQYALSAAVAVHAVRFRRIAREYRLRTPEHFRGVRLTGMLDSEAVCGLIETLPEGTTELMCHPGMCDPELERMPTRLKREREIEVDTLTDPTVRRCIDERNVGLISYREIAREYV